MCVSAGLTHPARALLYCVRVRSQCTQHSVAAPCTDRTHRGFTYTHTHSRRAARISHEHKKCLTYLTDEVLFDCYLRSHAIRICTRVCHMYMHVCSVCTFFRSLQYSLHATIYDVIGDGVCTSHSTTLRLILVRSKCATHTPHTYGK